MQRSLYRSRVQFVLDLDRHDRQTPTHHAEGLVEALAELLLEALRGEAPTIKGGEDEHQDHA